MKDNAKIVELLEAVDAAEANLRAIHERMHKEMAEADDKLRKAREALKAAQKE